MKIYTLLCLFLITFSLTAQDYNKQWKEIIELEKTVSIKSALAIVEKIEVKARRSKNEPQLIRAFLYKSKYLQHLDEDAQTKIIGTLQKEILNATPPTKAIYNYIYAVCLQEYLQFNQYRLNNRTPTEGEAGSNFLTWTKEQIENEIQQAINNSLSEKNILRKTPITEFKDILEYSRISNLQEYSLYDFLIDKYIEFHSTPLNTYKNYLTSFTNNNKQDFYDTPEVFIEIHLDSITDVSLKNSLRFYQMKEESKPLPENRLERMQFLHTYVFKETTYFIHVLDNFQKGLQDNILVQKVQLQKAILHEGLANKETHPNALIKARILLDSIIDQNIDPLNNKWANYHKQKILNKSITVRMNQYSYENENSRVHISYKNIDSLYIKFYKVPAIYMFEKDAQINDTLVKTLSKSRLPDFTETINLPPTDDYFETSTQALLPQLPLGKYIVLFEASENSIQNNQAYTYSLVTVTNLAVLHHQVEGKTEMDKIFQLIDRKKGTPQQDVTIHYRSKSLKTDINGNATFITPPEHYSVNNFLLAHKIDDSIYLPIHNWALNFNSTDTVEEKEEMSSFLQFYSDRGIYRPGQTAYIKGVVLKKHNKKTTVASGITFSIIIKNPKYKEEKKFTVHTNEFGSFSLEFEIPLNGMTGMYYFEAKVVDIANDKTPEERAFWDNANFNYSRFNISVEEYKRPTFNVKMDAVKEAYSVNDSIKFHGVAKAFSGVNISNAKVVYRVERQAQTRWRFRRHVNSEFISEGETITDLDGKITIKFKAIPDESFTKESLPVFNYIAYIDVTDINGETQSSQQSVKIGYHSLLLDATVDKDLYLDPSKKIILSSTNLNGEFVPVKGNVQVYFQKKLQPKFIEPQFASAEKPLISDKEFEILFPFEKKTEAGNPEANGELLISRDIDTEVQKEINLDFLKTQPSGHYRVVFTAHEKGENIETTSEFRLLNKNQPTPDELFTLIQKNDNPYKDKFLLLEIRSFIPDLFVNIQGVDTRKRTSFYGDHKSLKNGFLSIKIPFNKNMPTDIAFHVEAFFENHFFDKDIRVVKEEDSSLDVEIISMRNKLDPGSNETWSFKIANENKAAEAEVLASMYDQSLDEFRSLNWGKPEITSYNYYNTRRWQKNTSWQKNTLHLKNLNPHLPRPSLFILKTDLQWFGFSFGSTTNYARSISYNRFIAAQRDAPENVNAVYGVVTDDSGLPIPGVNIIVKGTKRGTQSDFDGYYEIEIDSGEELVFSYVGFSSQIITPAKGRNNIAMEVSGSLDEVVITAYGVAESQRSITGSGQPRGRGQVIIRGRSTISGGNDPLIIIDGVIMEDQEAANTNYRNMDPSEILNIEVLKLEAKSLYGEKAKHGAILITTKRGLEELTSVQTRKNFQETAFFHPQLRTNQKGEIQFDFTTPEALTSWKFRLLAHDKQGKSGFLERTAITQKDLMITPNMPRFLRELDTITITARIANITSESKSGTALLQFYNAVDMSPLETGVILSDKVQVFQTEAKGNTVVSWVVTIPKGIQGIQYKVVAKSGNFTDGEENILPVLTNTLLVTESISMWVREHTKEQFTLENLKNNNSTTLQHHKLTFEYTANPVWLAIEALPYLMEFEHDCSEQIFARYYANKLALKILDNNPEIAKVFEKWKNEGKPLSKLAQNEELKNILLAETPWLLDSESEEERNNRMALLFDLDKLSQSADALINKLGQMQAPSGGFPWFQGGRENVNITQHILSGLAKLENHQIGLPVAANEIIKNGLRFSDNKFLERHNWRDNKTSGLKVINPAIEIDYLYLRSFYLDEYPLEEKIKSTLSFYLENIIANWPGLDLQRKAKATLVLHRFDKTSEAKIIINGLRETSALNTESGMYWIANKPGWRWQQSPIENQALLISAFDEVEKDTEAVEMMKIWLLKNKQTKSWGTTKATTEAIYALLSFGKNPLQIVPDYNIHIGKDSYSPSALKDINPTAGSGYIKLSYSEEEITNEKSDIIIENKSAIPGFGGVYWQYFEELDKIKPAPESLFQIQKELYVKRNTPSGQQLQQIDLNNKLQTGDILTVRLIIETKENVEYVHLKDMRASGLEPVNVISQYKWQDGLGYYQSTRDAATHFFFDKIDSGTYVIEYDLRVNNAGNYSNGITTIQSMYAPEFSHHTAGMRLQAE